MLNNILLYNFFYKREKKSGQFEMGLKRSGLMIILLAAALTINGCGTAGNVELETAEDYFNRAKQEFNDEDWLEAQKYFDIIKLQFPASMYADDAQYYLAEINFQKGEYILSAFNYSTLRRLYPNSEFVKESMFKTALSYFKLSPTYDRDQEYTKKAIRAFSEYQAIYPNDDSLYSEASNYIQELRDKLAHGHFAKAGLYRKMQSIHSSLIYYDKIIEDFPDTKYFEPAYFGKIEVLVTMKKNDEALGIINLYKRLFPKSSRLGKVLEYEKQLKE